MMNRKERIEQILDQALKPAYLIVENESHQHHVPPDSETHFKVTLVAQAFGELGRLDRHRKINALLSTELNSGLHALSLHLYSPNEWKTYQDTVPLSPKCRGGFHHD